MSASDKLPDYSGHLSKNADGHYVGLISNGIDKPIRLTAQIAESPAGKYFVLDGMKERKGDEALLPPWVDQNAPAPPMPAAKEDRRFAGGVPGRKRNMQGKQ